MTSSRVLAQNVQAFAYVRVVVPVLCHFYYYLIKVHPTIKLFFLGLLHKEHPHSKHTIQIQFNMNIHVPPRIQNVQVLFIMFFFVLVNIHVQNIIRLFK